MNNRRESPAARLRITEIDALKAAAIVTVVFIHSLRASWDPGFTYVERLLSEAARFAVPAFLAVSGFLYYTDRPVTGAVLARRLRRILLPYLTVSLAAWVYVQAFPQFGPAGSLWSGLLLANTFGPYYYVFLLTEFVLATWLLSRMPRAWTMPVFALACVGALAPFLWFAEGVKPTLWTLRLPLLFFCWFMLGWAAAAHADRVREGTRSHRAAILLAWLAVVVVWFALDITAALPPRLSRASSLFLIAANIIGLYTAFGALDRAPDWVVALSKRTYAIYLLHLFFTYTVFALFGESRHTSLVASTALAWLAGMLGSLAVIAAVRRVAPSRSRDLIGAGIGD